MKMGIREIGEGERVVNIHIKDGIAYPEIGRISDTIYLMKPSEVVEYIIKPLRQYVRKYDDSDILDMGE